MASSPEAERPRATALLVALALAACSSGARSVRLPAVSPGDEIYRVSCEDTIRACRDEASEVCAGDYEVLESSGAPIQPRRVTSEPGPASTGPRYQRLKWAGTMVIACGRVAPGAEGVGHDESHQAGVQLATPDRLCIPGLTQECLGPGACRGAQACLVDGNGYGPCDCGNASTDAQSGSTLSARDAGAPRHD